MNKTLQILGGCLLLFLLGGMIAQAIGYRTLNERLDNIDAERNILRSELKHLATDLKAVSRALVAADNKVAAIPVAVVPYRLRPKYQPKLDELQQLYELGELSETQFMDARNDLLQEILNATTSH